MKSSRALLLLTALTAASIAGCETNVDVDDDHPGRGVGHARHGDNDADVRVKTDVPDVDVKGEVDVD